MNQEDLDNLQKIKSTNKDLYFCNRWYKKNRRFGKKYLIKKINFLINFIFLLFIILINFFLEGFIEETPSKKKFIIGFFI